MTFGCTDPNALNYNPNADANDGSCEYPVYGCTDEAALNYNPEATDDDGSCDYPFDCSEGTPATLYICTFSNGDNVALDLVDSEGNTFYSGSELGDVAIMFEDICIPDGCLTAVMSNLADENGRYNGYFWIQVDGETIYTNSLDSALSYEEANFSLNGQDCGECECDDVYQPVCVWDGFEGEYITFSNACEAECAGYTFYTEGECDFVEGCTDPEAINYNFYAVIDDGSCEHLEYVLGWTDPA
ncbi:MAG: hypothetical protein HRT74_09155, partial [Flavobacteriales bacterium]|nr:hypothetical protein [Flavobacteriales bacterium]